MILIIFELCHVSIAVTILNHINLFDYELSTHELYALNEIQNKCAYLYSYSSVSDYYFEMTATQKESEICEGKLFKKN